jgi:hypothetical protein
MDVSRHILVVDTSVLAKSNIGRREHLIIKMIWVVKAVENISMYSLYVASGLAAFIVGDIKLSAFILES